MKRHVTVMFFLCALLCSCAAPDKGAPLTTSVDHVDLHRYIGTWYEIGSFPMFFQRQCVANTQANYTVEPEGKVGVHNQCLTKNGIDKAEGVAEVVDGSNNARLRVSFFRPFWADYWIIGLDSEYRWAVVGNPDKSYMWILSRTKKLPQDQLEAALESARKQGFDLSKFNYTTQN